MALPEIPGVWRITLNWRHDTSGLQAHNVFHASAPSLDEEALVAATAGNFTNGMVECVAPGVELRSVSLIKLDGISPTIEVPLDPPYFEGTGEGEPILQCCAVVTLRTIQRGPRGRGRFYLPMVGESEQNNGLLASETVSVMQGTWSTWLTACESDGALIGVASYLHEDFNVATTAVVRTVVGTQRRRVDQLR